MKCPYEGCTVKQGYYAYNKNDKLKYCSRHKKDDMIDFKHPKCLKCNKIPTYNTIGEIIALYCFDHKTDNMIDIIHKKCLECNKRPTFNIEGTTTALYCFEHKKNDMIDVANKKCLECNKRPNFNIKGQITGLYCFDHKKEDMINVLNKQCLECDTQPTFNFEGQITALYCVKHKKNNMINIKDKKCLECNKIPIYNIKGQTIGLYCVNHKKNNMIDVKSKKCLECDKQPSFNIKGQTNALYCSNHKKDNMIDVINKKCELCKLIRVNPKYKNHCARCHFYLNPNDPRIINYKTKETAITSKLKELYSDIVLDSRINGGCSRRRPDALLDLLTHIIIIEVDENEHKSYDDSCNNRRIMELSQDLNHRSIVFIRVNPDSYKINDKRYKGCFSLSKTGVLQCNNKLLNERIGAVIEKINYHKNIIPDKSITIEYLYFSDD